MTLTFHPTAKINLTLRVGIARADGFHDVRTLLQSIDLSDTLTISSKPGPFALVCRAGGVPSDRRNLVWRAADLLWRAAGYPGDPRDARVRLVKRIPSAAGLGGGSADAAAALVGLNKLWKTGKSRRDLIALASQLGSDVPFFLFGGTAMGIGRGEDLYPVDDIRRLDVVVVAPSIGVATADAYRWFDEDSALPPGSTVDRWMDVGWRTGPVPLRNDLEGPVSRRHPVVADMIDACRRAGALTAAMTGSGSAVFGLFPSGKARGAVRRLRRADWRIFLSRTLTRREAGRQIGL